MTTRLHMSPYVHISSMSTFNFTKYDGFPGGSYGKGSVWNVGDLGLIPGSGRSSGEGNDNPL